MMNHSLANIVLKIGSDLPETVPAAASLQNYFWECGCQNWSVENSGSARVELAEAGGGVWKPQLMLRKFNSTE